MTLCIICVPLQLNELKHTCRGEPNIEVFPPSASLAGKRFTGMIIMPGVRDYIYENYPGDVRRLWETYLACLERSSTLTVVPADPLSPVKVST